MSNARKLVLTSVVLQGWASEVEKATNGRVKFQMLKDEPVVFKKPERSVSERSQIYEHGAREFCTLSAMRPGIDASQPQLLCSPAVLWFR